jgi:adenine specific DNA methylase Mod
MYLHQILLTDENKFDQNRLDQLKTVKEFAQKIIYFIAQFENELVRVWNKPKFALNSNYVITIDKLTEEIVKKLEKHARMKDQVTEWVELGMIETGFDFKNREDKHKYLSIDTKYFKDLEIEILDLFDNLDEALDGRLIHSENYQALNTLQEKYKEKVQCIYIDPPFNTGSDFAYVDKFQDSTWLTLMNDRISLARKFLKDDGSFYLHLDRKANYLGRFILENNFYYYRNEIIWKYFVSGKYPNEFAKDHDVIMVYSNIERNLFNYTKERDEDLYKQKKDNDEVVIGEDGIEYYKYNGELRTFEKQLTETWNLNKVKRDGNEILGFDTQKPEKLMERILLASSNEGSYIMDFFTGSATTIATAHKLGRKWIGVEMGEHFNDVDLPRMKTVLSGKISGISKDLEKDQKLKKGGFFKYERLEQYEDTLRNMKYKENSPSDIFDTRKPFENYVFYADQKFAHVVDVKKDDIELDFDKLYSNIDFAETISNIKGLPIKKITQTGVLLEGGEKEIKTDFKNMTQDEKVEFIKLLKPLLWWGE